MRLYSVLFVLLSVGLLLGCRQSTEAPPAPSLSPPTPVVNDLPTSSVRPKASSGKTVEPIGTNDIAFTGTELTIAGKKLPWPMNIEQLVEVLGEPDRVVDLSNQIRVWDENGTYAYSKPGKNRVNSLAIDYVKKDSKFSPAKVFPGVVHLPKGPVNKQATPQTLVSAGLRQAPDLPFIFEQAASRYEIIAIYESDRLEGISFSDGRP